MLDRHDWHLSSPESDRVEVEKLFEALTQPGS